jgi:hypothetical protein
MPTAISLPSCLMDCYKILYPKLDFSRVAFYSGLPSFVSLGGPDGFTMASGAASPDIRVYIKDYEPCGKVRKHGEAEETFLTIAHELVHVVQIQGMLGGGRIPGSWTAYYASQTFNCSRGWGTCSNRLEDEAYAFANGTTTADGPGYCGADGQVRGYVEATQPFTLPCNCAMEPWPVANSIGGETYAQALHDAGLCKTTSDVGRSWCSLLTWPLSLIAGAFSIFGFSNLGGAIGAGVGALLGGIIGGFYGGVFGFILGGPFGAAIGGFLGALLGALLGAVIGGAIGWAISEIGSWIGGLFSGPAAMIWFTAFDGSNWVIPDIPVSQNGHSLTSDGPAMALFNGKLFLAYKGKDSDDLWFTTCDGQSLWLTPDLEITQNGHSKTDAKPALAAFNGKLFLAYKGSGSNDLWFNTFDGTNWLNPDLEITQNGHSKTDAGPALAAFNGKLFLAYKGSGSNDLWFNTFDGSNWLNPDLEITQNGHSKTDASPALAVFNGKLFLAYKGAGSNDLWFNTFDGVNWLAQDLKVSQNGHSQTDAGPALAVYNGKLYLAYKGSGSDDIWYNVFDGANWQAQDLEVSRDGHVKTGRGPALAAFGQYLFMAYRDNS